MDISVLLAWVSIGLGLAVLALTGRFECAWRRRRTIMEVVYAVLIAGGLFVVGGISENGIMLPVLYVLAAGVVGFLAARLQFGRLPEDHLRRSTVQASLVALAVSFMLLVLQSLRLNVDAEAIIGGILLATLVLACLFALQTIWALKHYTDRRRTVPGWGSNPPTVTLAIPARNETHALSHCLNAALSSNYPRLEILVLDDCSQDKTSQLIRSFAHAGVRFVQGEVPASGWLGKNNAYATLEKESTGEYIFFMGVDTHLKPSTITHLVSYIESKSLDMVSVLPRQRSGYLLPLAMQHLRYVWQIVLPLDRKRVPVSTESWLVKRSSLQRMGGFDAFKDAVVPESSLAKRFAADNNYRFIMADERVPISYGKKWSSQFDTSSRLWYPALDKRPFAAVGLGVCLLAFGVGPFIALFSDNGFIAALAAATCLAYLLTYAAILRRLQPGIWWLSVWFLPGVLIQEAIVVFISMAKYEFMTVDWKGRNICYPVLGVER